MIVQKVFLEPDAKKGGAAMTGFKHMAALGGVVRKTVMRGYPRRFPVNQAVFAQR
jgi:hypothetical protein